MKKFKLNNPKYRIVLAAITILAIGGTLVGSFLWPSEAQAHCDAYQGPVVGAARAALENGDVNLILPYVQAEDEAELTAAFKQASEVRTLGSEAQELADQYFFEVAVRLHRQGEGAAYTGLKDEKVPEVILVADQAMLDGNLDPVTAHLTEALHQGIQEKYDAVLEAREHAEKEGTVEAHRERVEAELMFEKYAYDVYTLINMEDLHEGGGHGH